MAVVRGGFSPVRWQERARGRDLIKGADEHSSRRRPGWKQSGRFAFGPCFVLAGQHLRRNFPQAADDKERVSADQANLGLAVFVRAKISDLRRHHEIIAAARLELDKLHGVVSLERLVIPERA